MVTRRLILDVVSVDGVEMLLEEGNLMWIYQKEKTRRRNKVTSMSFGKHAGGSQGGTSSVNVLNALSLYKVQGKT